MRLLTNWALEPPSFHSLADCPVENTVSEKPLMEVEIMLRDLEEGAQRLGQGSGMGSGCSEPGSDIT